MINYISKGNIFKIRGVCNYGHGCNCAGAMGKGIALEFKSKFSKMYNAYKKLCLEGKFLPGDVFLYKYSDGYVFNLGTQKTWRTKATLSAIEKSFNTLFELASKNNIDKIAIPRIGAGLGGLNWDEVKQIIEKTAKKYNSIDLYVVEEFEDIETVI